MRKLMIAMLALAVVFGFAACDNSTGNSGASQLDVAYIVGTEKTATDYLVGETPKAEDFTFTGYDVAGNVVIDNMSAELFTADALSAGDEDAGFRYLGVLGSTIKVTAPVTVYEIEKLTVDATADTVKKSYYTISEVDGVAVDATSMAEGGDYYAYTLVDKTGLVVTATYNGTAEKVIDADDYTAVLGTVNEGTETGFAAIDWTSATLTGKDAVVRISMDGTTADDYYAVNYSANVVKTIYVDVADDYVLYYGINEDSLGASDKLSATDVVAKGVMVNGQEGVELSESLVGAGVVKYSLTENGTYGAITSLDLTGETSVTVWAKLESAKGVVPNFNPQAAVSATVPVEQDSYVGLEITVGTAGFELDTDYGADDATAPTGFTVKYKMASGITATEELKLNASNGYTINPTEFSSKVYIAGSPVTVTVSAGGFSKTVESKIANS